MFTFSMMQRPAAIKVKVYEGPGWMSYKGEPGPRVFDVAIDAWRLNHQSQTAEQVTLKFTDLALEDLVRLKDEVCTAIQEAMLNKGKEVKGNEG